MGLREGVGRGWLTLGNGGGGRGAGTGLDGRRGRTRARGLAAVDVRVEKDGGHVAMADGAGDEVDACAGAFGGTRGGEWGGTWRSHRWGWRGGLF